MLIKQNKEITAIMAALLLQSWLLMIGTVNAESLNIQTTNTDAYDKDDDKTQNYSDDDKREESQA